MPFPLIHICAYFLWCVTHSGAVRRTRLLFQVHAALNTTCFISMNKRGLFLNSQLFLIFMWAALFSSMWEHLTPPSLLHLVIFRPRGAFTSSRSFTGNHAWSFLSESLDSTLIHLNLLLGPRKSYLPPRCIATPSLLLLLPSLTMR